ncbi:MAG: TolC family protein [Thermoanaerobaculaceae bacterium]|nr:TolC family protein [Thermoanaerobaculaceae bacterium]
MKWLAALLAAAVFVPASARSLTIEEATARALAANPRLQAAKLSALAAAQRAQEAAGRRYGEVDLVGSYNHYDSNRSLVPISVDLFKNPSLGFYQLPWDRNQLHYGIAYQIPLLAGGQLHEGRLIAKLAQRAADDLAFYGAGEARYNVRAAYRNALTLTHALTAVTAYERALENDAKDADLKVKVGAWASVDGAKIHFALASARAQREAVQAGIDSLDALLAALMGEDLPPEGYALADVPEAPAPPAGTLRDNAEAALGGRRDLAAVKVTVAIAERKRILAKEAFGPQLMLGGNVMANSAPGVEDRIDTNEFGLYLKLPLFEGGQRVHALRAAAFDLQAARRQQRAKELEVLAQVQDALGRVQAARAQLAAGEAQRSLGSEVARVEHLKLEQGTGKMEDYLAARTQEMQGETGYWQGLYALQSAVDYLDFVSAQGGQHD